MKTLTATHILFFITFLSFSQTIESKLEDRKETIETLFASKKDIQRQITSKKQIIAKITDEKDKEQLGKDIDSLKKVLVNTDEKVQSACKSLIEYKYYLTKYEQVHDSIVSKYTVEDCTSEIEKSNDEETKTFYIIGDNKPISEDSLFTSKVQKEVILDAFNAESESKLGRFEVPGDNSPINFYIKEGKEMAFTFNSNHNKRNEMLVDRDTINMFKVDQSKKDGVNKRKTVYIPLVLFDKLKKTHSKFQAPPKDAKFKSLGIELSEGSIVDARLLLENENAYFYFEITAPISILNYTRKSPKRNYLMFSHYISKNNTLYDENQLREIKVKLIDVLVYHPNLGSNFVPDNISYNFPSKESSEDSKTTERRGYEVINNTKLQHVLDLRAYTDALGLFDDEANGIFQMEGKADIFIHPFNFPRTALYYLKKVSPYVRYSRLDNDKDVLNANMASGTFEFDERKLELLQRSNLEMGLDMNIINFRWFKESPFWTSLRFPLTYHVTPIKTLDTVNHINFKTLGFGIAADIELKRYNNFGLNLGYELKGYSYLGDYETENLMEPGYLKTQAVKAEIFYYPNNARSQSIFLRMKSIRDISTGKASFFQLQFGYRFTVGISSVKAK